MHTMRDFGVIFERVSLMCDNTNAIFVVKNLVFHKIIRHLERRHHFLRNHVKKGDIEMRYIDTERQLTDIFTKPLDVTRFASLRGQLGVYHPCLGLRGSLCFVLYILYPISFYYYDCFSFILT
jgi:hypothetical protein